MDNNEVMRVCEEAEIKGLGLIITIGTHSIEIVSGFIFVDKTIVGQRPLREETDFIKFSEIADIEMADSSLAETEGDNLFSSIEERHPLRDNVPSLEAIAEGLAERPDVSSL